MGVVRSSVCSKHIVRSSAVRYAPLLTLHKNVFFYWNICFQSSTFLVGTELPIGSHCFHHDTLTRAEARATQLATQLNSRRYHHNIWYDIDMMSIYHIISYDILMIYMHIVCSFCDIDMLIISYIIWYTWYHFSWYDTDLYSSQRYFWATFFLGIFVFVGWDSFYVGIRLRET